MTSLRSPLRSSLRSPLYSALTGKYGGSTVLGYGTGAAALADTLREERNVFAARAADDSLVVRDQATPANNVVGRIDDILNYTSATPKLIFGWDGVMRYNAHNMFLNSGTPATQSITVTSGLTYKVKVNGGTTSVALSGAGTGTASDGSPVEITASTTTLTCTVSGSGGTVQVFRSPADETYVATTGTIRWYLPVDWDPATLVTSSTSALIINGVVGLSKTFAYTGDVFTVGADVRAYDSANPETNYLVGKVTAASSGSVTIQVFRSVGSGTITSWKLIQCKGWLIEPAATNYVDYSISPSNWFATSGASFSAGDVSPFGTASVRITSTETGVNLYPLRPGPAATNIVCWSIIKKGSGAGEANEFRVRDDTAGINLIAGSFNYDTLDVAYITGSSGVTLTEIVDGWLLFEASVPWVSGNICRYNIGYQSNIVTAGEHFDHAFSMIETGTVPTSPIITAGTSLNRLADGVSISTSKLPWNTSEGTLVQSVAVSDADYLWYGVSGGNSARYAYATGNPTVYAFNGANSYNYGTASDDVRSKYGLAFNASLVSRSKDGAAVVEAAASNDNFSNGVTNLALGSITGGPPYQPIRISSIKYLPRRISNSDLQSEATL